MKALYDKGREAFLKGQINWEGDTIKAIAVDAGAYTVDIANHQYLSSIPAGARIATSAALSGKTSTAGVADANDVTFTGVTGASIEAYVLYKDTGVEGTSSLICYVDEGTGLPVTPSGGDIILQFDNGVNKIFKL